MIGLIKNDHGGEGMTKRVLKQSAPIMISYILIGIVCGMVSYEVGFSIYQIGMMSIFIYSGASQFMIAGMYAKGASVLSIIITVMFLSVRFILLSLTSSKYIFNQSGLFLFFYGTTITDETFGLNYLLFEKGDWQPEEALSFNLINYFTWIIGTILGAALVSVITLDTTIISYGLTALFIFMTASQFVSKVYVLTGAIAMMITTILIIITKSNIAIVLGAVIASYIGLRLKWRFGGEVV